MYEQSQDTVELSERCNRVQLWDLLMGSSIETHQDVFSWNISAYSLQFMTTEKKSHCRFVAGIIVI